jgi:hypothetical protein
VQVFSFTHRLVIGLGLLSVFPGLLWSQSACDLNQDGIVDSVDVQLITNMVLGLAPCTANIVGPGVCNIVAVQRVTNAVQGGTCVTDPMVSTHSVSLNWTGSTSSGVIGYNVYRGTVSGGPYTIVNSSLVTGTGYTDGAVEAGMTYYYVATAVNGSAKESAYSSEALAVVPSP